MTGAVVIRASLAAGLAVATASTAQAGPWLLPHDTNFSGTGPWVTVDASASDEAFYFDHALNLDEVKAIGPDGAVLPLENAQRGRFRSTFDVHLTQPGTTRIAVTTANVMGTYVVEGVTYRLNTFRRGPGGPGGGAPQGGPGGAGSGPPPADQPGRPRQGVSDPAQIPAGATDIKLVQAQSRSETFVTSGAPTAIKPMGAGLELVEGPSFPTDAAADEPATYRLLLDGKPAAGVKVTATAGDLRYLKGPAPVTVTTRADGAFSVKWPAAGRYLLTATAEGPGSIPNAVRRSSYSAVLEVQKP